MTAKRNNNKGHTAEEGLVGGGDSESTPGKGRLEEWMPSKGTAGRRGGDTEVKGPELRSRDLREGQTNGEKGPSHKGCSEQRESLRPEKTEDLAL